MMHLTEDERETLERAFASSSRSPHHLAFLATPAVEAILTARLARVEDRLAPVEEAHGTAILDLADANDRLARVEALADDLDLHPERVSKHLGWLASGDVRDHLRAALAAAPDDRTPKGEAMNEEGGADLQEALDCAREQRDDLRELLDVEREQHAEALNARLTHPERETLRPVLARYARWSDAHDGPVFEAIEGILAGRHALAAAPSREADQ